MLKSMQTGLIHAGGEAKMIWTFLRVRTICPAGIVLGQSSTCSIGLFAILFCYLSTKGYLDPRAYIWKLLRTDKRTCLKFCPFVGIPHYCLCFWILYWSAQQVLCSSRSIWVIWVSYFEWERWLGAGNACSRGILSSPNGQTRLTPLKPWRWRGNIRRAWCITKLVVKHCMNCTPWSVVIVKCS